MIEDTVYEALGKLTAEMYLGFAKTQSSRMQDQLLKYHSQAEDKISKLVKSISQCSDGEAVDNLLRKIQILRDDFSYMKNDISDKYKIYVRGCGNAGKSTLLNALLSLDESVGSRMGRLPMTFIIDIYTDELSVDDAEIRIISSDGKGNYTRVKRSVAISMENEEEQAFSESKNQCRKLIEEKTKKIFLEQEREDIETDIYKQYLLKTKIREIRWGIGSNEFFHNCILIDTPGLSQELRFTNVIEDVKNYEVDGIIWVISSETLAKQEVIDAYKQEFEEMREIYSGKKVIAVINMYGSGPDYVYGSKQWKRVEKKARTIYCDKYGFDDLICVNAKLAYDGNVNNDLSQLEQSNISELRRKINEMFIERTPETYHYARLDKIESFLDNLYREAEEGSLCLAEFMNQYKDKKNKIKIQSTACQVMVEEEKDKVARRHLTDIKSRIEANAVRVKNLDQESFSSREQFLRYQIVQTDALMKDMFGAIDNCKELIYSRFKDQQIRSVVSGYRTEQFAFQFFEKANSSIRLKKNNVNDFSFKAKTNGWDTVGEWVDGLFGNNDISRAIKGVLRWVRNAIESPQERLYEGIRNDIKNWTNKLELSEEIEAYERICIKTLDKSMEQACGRYKDVEKLYARMEKFISEKPHMIWKKVGIQELIGGTENV